MADQKRWFKVWTSILSDDDFDSSRPGALTGLGRFAKLGAYTALHGERGVVEVMPDTLLRMTNSANIDELRGDLALKNVSFEEGKNRYGKVTVTWQKWQYYQEDSTAKERMKTLRAKRRREEIRGEENKYVPTIVGTYGAAPSKNEDATPPLDDAQGLRLVKSEAPECAVWPDDLARVPEVLTQLGVEHPPLHDPKYWRAIDEWIEGTKLPIYYLDEFKAYFANQSSKRVGQKGWHKDLKAGFRNWLSTAVRWKERDNERANYRRYVRH